MTYPPNGPVWEDPATRGYPPTQPGQPFSGQPYSGQPYGQPDPYAYPPVSPPVPVPYAYAQPVVPIMPVVPMVATVPTIPTSGLATASMVLGIVGLAFGWCLFAIPSVLAIIFGHLGMNDTKYNQRAGRGMAVAGLVLGYVALVPMLWLTFVYWNLLGHAATVQ